MLDNILDYLDDPLMKRAFLFIEEGDWVKANAYLEDLLNQNPENGLAYLGKLMIDTQAHTCAELMDLANPFDDNLNYKRCIRYADQELASELSRYNVYIKERNDIVQTANFYNSALVDMENAKTMAQYEEVIEKFQRLGNYENAASLLQECVKRLDEIKGEKEFRRAEKLLETASEEDDYVKIAHIYESIASQRDVKDKIDLCYKRAEKCRLIKKKKEEDKKARADKARNILRRILALLKYIVPAVVFAVVLDSVFVTYKGYSDYKQSCEIGDISPQNTSADIQKALDDTENVGREIDKLLEDLEKEMDIAHVYYRSCLSKRGKRSNFYSYRYKLYCQLWFNDVPFDSHIPKLERFLKLSLIRIEKFEAMKEVLVEKLREGNIDIPEVSVSPDDIVKNLSMRDFSYCYRDFSKKCENLRDDINCCLKILTEEKKDINNFRKAIYLYNHKDEYKPDIWPVNNGWVTAEFGKCNKYSVQDLNDIDGWLLGDFDNDDRSFHPGLDIAVVEGDKILAAASGCVTSVCWKNGYGQYIEIKHEFGYSTVYSHMSEVKVRENDHVAKGQVIGLAGCTGSAENSHLHYEILLFGEQVNPRRIIK